MKQYWAARMRIADCHCFDYMRGISIVQEGTHDAEACARGSSPGAEKALRAILIHSESTLATLIIASGYKS